jgi:AbrB family looped-hinge helix DNA binding protein
MKEITSTITGKGQVTIPAEVRRRLGVAPSDQISFVILDNGTVEVRPARYSVAELRSIIPAIPGRTKQDFDAEIAEAMAEGAAGILDEGEEE